MKYLILIFLSTQCFANPAAFLALQSSSHSHSNQQSDNPSGGSDGGSGGFGTPIYVINDEEYNARRFHPNWPAYSWVDKNGVTNFSNSYPENMRKKQK